MSPIPPIIDPDAQRYYGEDVAKYLINPGSVRAPGRHSPGQLRHARPYLANGSKMFVFPTPIEGFSRTGQAQLGLRHYIGDWHADGITVHYEEGRITLNGLFPGQTSQINMVDCLMMLRSKHVGRGLILYAPGLFFKEQFVLPENWDFTHDEDDRTHSIHYSITLVKIGEGAKVKDPLGMPPLFKTPKKSKPKGKATRIWTVKAGARTLKTIAAKPEVYNNVEKWKQLVSLNKQKLEDFQKKSGAKGGSYKLANVRLPVGFKLNY